MPHQFVVVPDQQLGSSLQSPTGIVAQYVLVVDGRPEPIVVIRQVGPSGALVTLTTGRRGPQGDEGPPGPSAYEDAVSLGYEGTLQQWIDGIRGFYLADSPDDEPPEGTPDRTFVFERT